MREWRAAETQSLGKGTILGKTILGSWGIASGEVQHQNHANYLMTDLALITWSMQGEHCWISVICD